MSGEDDAFITRNGTGKNTPKPSSNKAAEYSGRSGMREKLGIIWPSKKKPTPDIFKEHMPRSQCYDRLNTLMFLYNIFLLLFGLGVGGFGVWFLMKRYSAIAVLIGSKLFMTANIVLISGGGFIVLMSLCGCRRSTRENRCFLGFYAIVLGLIVLVLATSGTIAVIFAKSAGNSTTMDGLQMKLQESYGVDLHQNQTNRLITDAWDAVQETLKCCGLEGNINSTRSWAFFKLHAQWYFQTNLRIPYVPESCCSNNVSICQGIVEIFGPPTKGPPVDKKYELNDHLYTEGCYDKAIQHIQSMSILLILVAFSVPAMLIGGMVLTFWLCAKTPKTQKDDHHVEVVEPDSQGVVTIYGH